MNINLKEVFEIAISLARIRAGARELFAKGITVAQIEESILASDTPLLPEVHEILVNTEREVRERGVKP